MLTRRSSGILLHLTSLPSAHGVGDMGPAALRFADFLAEAGQSVWQILPVNPTEPLHGHSPYSVSSTFAGNPLLISMEALVEDGFLEPGDLEQGTEFSDGRADYERAAAFKDPLLRRAWQRFRNAGGAQEFSFFCRDQAWWLADHALFTVLRKHHPGKAWIEWPVPLRRRDREALKRAGEMLEAECELEMFIQYLFFLQWRRLKSRAAERGIRILGDLPIYVNHDSADVWSHPSCFQLDTGGRPLVVSGVPPDYYSATGQLWGNPVYDWENLRSDGYGWWMKRLSHALSLFDWIRIDHFRGLVAYWEVAAGADTAMDGRWVPAPAREFLRAVKDRGYLKRIIAEDLGIITADVRQVMKTFGLPGMKVLLFAFAANDPSHPYLPHNYHRNCVVYTGTHDNLPAKGWMEEEASVAERQRLCDYLGREVSSGEVSWSLIRLGMMSVAGWSIFPMQDVLALGSEAALNRPSTRSGNWLWRLLPGQADEGLACRLRTLTRICGRDPENGQNVGPEG